MKIAVLGTRGIPNNYGGFEQFAEYLSIGLAKKGHSVTVYSPHFHYYNNPVYKNVIIRKKYNPEKLIGSSANLFYDYLCLKDALNNKFDIILECGYGSSSYSYYLLNINRSVIITNMDGIEWQRSKWGIFAKKILKIAEKLAVKKSHSIISDNVCIKEYYKNKYNIESEYIPYGAIAFSTPDKNLLTKFSLCENDYFLAIARLEPENNLEIILDGYVSSNTDNKLVIISNKDTKYAKYLINKYNKFDKIFFIGNNYDQNELANLRYFSKAYFHGHSVGGTNPSLLEAMGSQSLIIAHNNIYNKSILNSDAFYFNNSGDIINIINDLENTFPAKEDFIKNNLKKIETIYNWNNIVNQYDNLFQKLINQNHS